LPAEFNVVDIIILALLGAFAIKGLFRGLLQELCSLAGLFTGGYLSFRYHSEMAEFLGDAFGLSEKITVSTSFVLIFLGTVILFLLLGQLLSRFVKLLFLGWVNRAVGGLFALLQGVLLLTLILWTLAGVRLPETIQPHFKGSVLAPPFVHLGDSVLDAGRTVYERSL